MPSTVIDTIDYDETTRELSVTFVGSGRRYVYLDVPKHEVDAFRHAFSKGVYFNTRIRNRYTSAEAEAGN